MLCLKLTFYYSSITYIVICYPFIHRLIFLKITDFPFSLNTLTFITLMGFDIFAVINVKLIYNGMHKFRYTFGEFWQMLYNSSLCQGVQHYHHKALSWTSQSVSPPGPGVLFYFVFLGVFCCCWFVLFCFLRKAFDGWFNY